MNKVVVHLMDGSAQTYENAAVFFEGAWVVVAEGQRPLSAPDRRIAWPAQQVAWVEVEAV